MEKKYLKTLEEEGLTGVGIILLLKGLEKIETRAGQFIIGIGISILLISAKIKEKHKKESDKND